MKIFFLLLSVLLSSNSFAGYAYGNGSDQARLSKRTSNDQPVTEPTTGQNTSSPRQKAFSLYQVKGVVLGKTNRAELLALGAQPARENSYRHQGYEFWYNPATDSVYSLIINDLQIWPQSWHKVGFSPQLKYQDFVSWLEASGFLTIKTSLHLEGTMISNQRVLLIKMDFNSNNEVTSVSLISTPRINTPL